MKPNLVVDPKLVPIVEELKELEPIFHRLEFGITYADIEDMIDSEFWEVGASGKRYCKEDVITTVTERYKNPNYSHEDIWETKDFHCTEISTNNYLLTYTLTQGIEKRKTHRCTIWRRIGKSWKILYHQGTIIQTE